MRLKLTARNQSAHATREHSVRYSTKISSIINQALSPLPMCQSGQSPIFFALTRTK